ncbi:Lsr2 family protein [Amycolatopsis rubida]|uniref:Lsr2 family protein n=1 Tax=Amycolatopsis rubida TaxID=112413 RepID=A0ABX0C575_9PSEU|nr:MULTISPECIES: Lsr2 family protein [Amycolatopsis]MYW96799.1 Lsr2 family protein [Amycolatopsis rubida]NEC61784.1 Lsr2 family protein [Amycolatopsis rubida]OAP25730.1 Nucleoid-associated protein Lsr2 [Amycolatopsis sp. M39]
MAQKVHVEMVDDIDGSIAEQTVPFSLDGVSYEIDLSEDNAAALRDELARYVAASRRVGGRKVRMAAGQSPRPASTAADRERNKAMREWAENNGFTVSDRGRLPAEIVKAYEERDTEAPAKPARKRATRKKASA